MSIFLFLNFECNILISPKSKTSCVHHICAASLFLNAHVTRNSKKQFWALLLTPRLRVSACSSLWSRSQCGSLAWPTKTKSCQMLSCIILSFHPVCRSTPSSTVGRRTRQGQTPPASPSPTMASLWLRVEARTIYLPLRCSSFAHSSKHQDSRPLSLPLRANRAAVSVLTERVCSCVWWLKVWSAETNRSNSTRESFTLHFWPM